MIIRVPIRMQSWVSGSSLRLLLFYLLLSCCASVPAGGADHDDSGIVMDAHTGERIPYATVLLKGTSIRSEEQCGRVLRPPADAPARLCSLEVRYLGYATQDVRVDARTPVAEPRCEDETDHPGRG